MREEVKDREINLMELLVHVLLHWRGILVAMLVGAVLLGGISYARSYQAAREQEGQAEALEVQTGEERALLEELLKAELTELQLRRVQYVINYEKLYKDKQSYLEHSVFMKINPNDVKKTELTFYVTSDDRWQSYDIEKVYEEVVLSSEAMEYIALQMSSTDTDISEIIKIDRDLLGTREGTSSFKVEISHYNEENCLEIAKALIDFVDGKQKELTEKLGTHNIEVINQAFSVATDLEILNAQAEFLIEMDREEDIIVRNKDAFADGESSYYYFLSGNNRNALEDEDTTSGDASLKEPVVSAPGVSKKYVVLGMALAVFMYIIVILAIYLMNSRLRVTDQLQELYGIPQMGTIPIQHAPKKFLGCVDRWIVRLCGRKQRAVTEEEALELAAMAVKMSADREADHGVCLVGCDLKEHSRTVCETIRERLEKENIHVRILNNILYDARSMGELEGIKGVVLVEKAGNTHYSEIASELELLQRQNIKVLGGIVVE